MAEELLKVQKKIMGEVPTKGKVTHISWKSVKNGNSDYETSVDKEISKVEHLWFNSDYSFISSMNLKSPVALWWARPHSKPQAAMPPSPTLLWRKTFTPVLDTWLLVKTGRRKKVTIPLSYSKTQTYQPVEHEQNSDLVRLALPHPHQVTTYFANHEKYR